MKSRILLLILSTLLSHAVLAADPKVAPTKRERLDVPEKIEGAANSKEVSLGLLVGLGAPSNSDLTGGSRLMFGVDAFAWISRRVELGGTYTSGEASTRRISLLGIETQYHFTAYTPGLYLGFAGGVTSIEPEQTFFPDFEDLYFGPKLGYTHYFTPELSMGLDLKFLYVMSGPSYTWVQALTGVRFHF